MEAMTGQVAGRTTTRMARKMRESGVVMISLQPSF
jgi:hypothetical protein